MLTKTAHADLSARIAPIDRQDGENAFELGFVKAAKDLGLTEPQFVAVYNQALANLQAQKPR